MKRLLELDQKNYTQDMPIDVRYCIRAVIIKNGRIAVQKGKNGEYKILGGGMEKGEDHYRALSREVLEEGGMYVVRDSMRLMGEILERHRDIFDESRVYECHTLYICEVEQETVAPQPTASETRKGYQLAWATPQEIIAGNGPFLYQSWILRDSRFVQMYVDGLI